LAADTIEPESDIPDPMISFQHRMAKATMDAHFLSEMRKRKTREMIERKNATRRDGVLF